MLKIETMATNIPVKTLLGYLPDSLIDRLCIEQSVDKQVKKLEGKIVFKLLLYGVLSSSQLSLNVLISLFDKVGFRSLIGVDKDFSTKRNSLADRLINLDSSFFKSLFEESVTIFAQHLPNCEINGYKIHVFDSTLVACSAKLLNFGMKAGRKAKDETHRYNHLKFTLGFNGIIPEKIKFYDQATDVADDVPLKEIVNEMAFSPKDIAVFDRGLKSRETFERFSQEGENQRLFVSRINPTKNLKVVKNNKIEQNTTDSLTILSDQNVRLYHKGRITKTHFRLIIAQKNNQAQDKIFFISNILDDLTAIDIANIYRLRWEIEKFFRFIKQNLNFSHLISRDYNAIKNMAYVMLIAAMFIALYAKLNKRKGFKINKLKFLYELEAELVKELIIICKGNPNLLNQYFHSGFGQ
jgi:Transposase DDE domain